MNPEVGTGGPDPYLENHKRAIGFHSNNGTEAIEKQLDPYGQFTADNHVTSEQQWRIPVKQPSIQVRLSLIFESVHAFSNNVAF